MSKNTVRYVARVVKHDVNGAGGYRYQYHIWASDSAYGGYRIISAVGPEGFVVKEHWLSKDANEHTAVEQRVRLWHADLDIIEVKKQ